MHYYQHHIGDFIRDTARLKDGQCMAYLRLIWMYYDTEKPLENNPKKLAFQIGSDAEDVELILEFFFQFDGESWRHKRCDAEIAEYRKKQDKARESANARWKNASAMQAQCERNANVYQNDANQEPITNIKTLKEKIIKKEKSDVSPTAQPTQKNGTRLPDDFEMPVEWIQWAKDENVLTIHAINLEKQKFIDYWHSVSGAKARKVDWFATWRNWIRNSYKSQAPPNNHKNQKFDPINAINGGDGYGNKRENKIIDIGGGVADEEHGRAIAYRPSF